MALGSAKTSTCAAEMILAGLSTPKGVGLIGAQTYPQLESTAMKEFKLMLTKDLVESEHVQRKELNLVNGYTYMFRTFDSEDKLRSLNLTHFWVEEASTIAYDIFVQLKTRLRNNATDNHFGIMSTNPDINWIRTDFLLMSEVIHGADTNYHQDPETIDKDYSTHIAATKANKYLPEGFYEMNAKNKPSWWVDRYLHGSFSHSEGQVFPMASEHFIEPFDILTEIKTKGWEVLPGADFGLRDPTVMLMAAVDSDEGICYIYDEHYETNKPIPYHAKKMQEMIGKVPHGLLRQAVGDPSGKQRSKSDMRSIFDNYLEYGIYFKAGSNALDAGIQKVYTYFSLGRVKIFNTCKNTTKELINYKYKPTELGSEKNLDEKPIDKDNHAIDTLRYIIQELPDDPNQLENKSYSPTYGNINNKDKHLPHALQENDSYSDSGWASYY